MAEPDADSFLVPIPLHGRDISCLPELTLQHKPFGDKHRVDERGRQNPVVFGDYLINISYRCSNEDHFANANRKTTALFSVDISPVSYRRRLSTFSHCCHSLSGLLHPHQTFIKDAKPNQHLQSSRAGPGQTPRTSRACSLPKPGVRIGG